MSRKEFKMPMEKIEEITLGEIIEIRFPKDSKEFWKKAKTIVDMFLEE